MSIYLSSYDVLINAQCIHCRVWIGEDERGHQVEFDGLPHSCTPRQRAWVKDHAAPLRASGELFAESGALT